MWNVFSSAVSFVTQSVRTKQRPLVRWMNDEWRNEKNLEGRDRGLFAVLSGPGRLRNPIRNLSQDLHDWADILTGISQIHTHTHTHTHTHIHIRPRCYRYTNVLSFTVQSDLGWRVLLCYNVLTMLYHNYTHRLYRRFYFEAHYN